MKINKTTISFGDITISVTGSTVILITPEKQSSTTLLSKEDAMREYNKLKKHYKIKKKK
jgi:hypothetical protein